MEILHDSYGSSMLLKVVIYFPSSYDQRMDRCAFGVAVNDILVWHWHSWCATSHQLDGIVHPDYSHSPDQTCRAAEAERVAKTAADEAVHPAHSDSDSVYFGKTRT